MISAEEARIFRISERNDVGSLLSSIPDLVPEIMDKLKSTRGKSKKEEKPEENIVSEKEFKETEIKVEEEGCVH
jgi:uncharacterized spore protein YtfJ